MGAQAADHEGRRADVGGDEVLGVGGGEAVGGGVEGGVGVGEEGFALWGRVC